MKMDWKKYFEQMIKMLREEENKLDEKKKTGGEMFNSASGEHGIDHWLREIEIMTNGVISFLDFLVRNKEISEQNARALKYELGWLATDVWAIKLDNYPTPHPPLSEEQN